MLRQQLLREIFEQPDAVRAALNGRVDISKGVMLEYEIGPAEIFKSMKHVILVGCGASRHAALVGEFLIERFARLPVEVDYASEFQHHDRVLGTDTLVIAVTQSGETSDTIAAMTQARNQGAFVFAVCNLGGSDAARAADSTLYTRSGDELSGVSTRTFTTQLVVFYLLAIFLADARGVMARDEIRNHLRQLNRVPELMERILSGAQSIEAIAGRLYERARAVYLASSINFPIALEGAFKLKQLSFIPAEAHPSAEIRNGPLSLVDRQTAAIILAPQDDGYSKALSNIEEVKTRNGAVLAIAAEGDWSIARNADFVFRIPETRFNLTPILTVIPLQLFAHYIGMLRNNQCESGFRYMHE